MSYNYEYPYTDYERYNSDWLLSQMKQNLAEWDAVKKDWAKFQSDQTAAWNAYKANMDNQMTTYQANLNRQFDDYKAQLNANLDTFSAQWNINLDDYKNAMNTALAAYQDTMNNNYNAFTTSINNALAAYESAMNNNWAVYKTQMDSWRNDTDTALDAWKTDRDRTMNTWFNVAEGRIRQQIEEMKTTLDNDFTSYTTSLNAQWDTFKAESTTTWTTWKTDTETALDAWKKGIEKEQADWINDQTDLWVQQANELQVNLKAWEDNTGAALQQSLKDWEQESLDNLNTDFDAFKATVDGTLRAMGDRLDVMQQTMEGYESEQSSLSETVDQLTIRIDAVASQASRIGVELDKAEISLKVVEQTATALKTQLDDVQREIDSAGIPEIKIRLSAVEQRASDIGVQLDSEVIGLHGEIARAEDSIADLGTRLDMVDSQITALIDKDNVLETAMASAHTEISALDERIESTEDDISSINDDINYLYGVSNKMGRNITDINTAVTPSHSQPSAILVSGTIRLVYNNVVYTNCEFCGLAAAYTSDVIIPVLPPRPSGSTAQGPLIFARFHLTISGDNVTAITLMDVLCMGSGTISSASISTLQWGRFNSI